MRRIILAWSPRRTDEALKLVADGITTVEELKKVAYSIFKGAVYDRKNDT